ncbi:MAG: B3/4 domain-containing protein [Thermomicrobiales bacterium]
MLQFTIAESFWALLPDAMIGAIAVHGFDNGPNHPECEDLLIDVADRVGREIKDADIGSLPAIVPWRAAYQTFGAKPSKYKSSIENMLRSVRAGRIRGINPLVDLYNAVSLTHRLPCGGEDLAQVQGPVRLIRAEGGEHFVPLGSDTPDPPFAGEVIYRDDVGAICRCWNWREAERTKITHETTAAFLAIEALPPTSETELREAVDELVELIGRHLGGKANTSILTRASGDVAVALS